MPDEGGFTISNTEPRLLGTKCPICQEDFATGQRVQKYRCGHAVCIDCFHEAVDLG
ncbi:MAG: RING finger domain-containing protein, partial [Candidatus Fonsibacter sp.]